MKTLLILAIIWVLLRVLYNDTNTPPSKSVLKKSTNNQLDINKIKLPPKKISPKNSVVTPAKISINPAKIQGNPNLIISLIDGEYRVFENYYVNGIQYTFGFPKLDCKDKHVWFGIEKKEMEIISHNVAMHRINTGRVTNKSSITEADDDLPF